MNRFSSTANAIRQSQAIEKLSALKDGTVVPIPIDLISRAKNVRSQDMDLNSVEFHQLVESIREVGLLHNPVVTISGEDIVCVSGHRRIAALEKLKQERVPCILRQFEKLELKDVAALLENTARKNLHPLDVAFQLLRLKESGYTQTRLQELMGKDRKTIGRFQKMATWPKEAKDLIFANPQKLKTGLLLQIASRDMGGEELVNLLKVKCGLAPKPKGPKPPHLNRTPTVKLADLNAFFVERNYPKRDQDLVMRALVDLGILKDAGSGILDPMRTEASVLAGELEAKSAEESAIPAKAAEPVAPPASKTEPPKRQGGSRAAPPVVDKKAVAAKAPSTVKRQGAVAKPSKVKRAPAPAKRAPAPAKRAPVRAKGARASR